MTVFAPIVIFAYKRPEHIMNMLESLKKCPEHLKSDIFIYCDGPRSPQDANQVLKTREVIKIHAPAHAEIIERDQNMGLANSIIYGVTKACNEYGRVIVLEDDLELSSQALDYFNSALEHYKDEERVMHIAGYMFPIKKDDLPPLFFYREASCWGWATWDRAWKHFEPDAQKLYDTIKYHKKEKTFNIEGSAFYINMLEQQIKGTINSWAIRWYASVFLTGGLALHARDAVTINNGNDGTGEHCTDNQIFNSELAKVNNNKLWPPTIIEDQVFLKRMESFWEGVNPKPSLYNVIKYKAYLLYKYLRGQYVG